MKCTLGDGFRVQARIITRRMPDVMKVPAVALFRSSSRWHVFVLSGGRARLRAVEPGSRSIAEVEILNGLEAGERVVLFPGERLQDGTRVRLRN